MKKCIYCGKEYPDEATACAIDGQSLLSPIPAAVAPELPKESLAKPKEPFLAWPAYQWRAVDAWKCLGMILVFGFFVDIVLLALDRQLHGFYHWRKSAVGHLFLEVVMFGYWVGTTLYFARTQTFAALRKAFGLDSKPDNCIWFGLVSILIVRAIGHLFIMQGWAKGTSSTNWMAFLHTHGSERYLYLIPPLLFAPLFEEFVNRGFLFKALRGSYSFGGSVAVILLWTAFTHWSQYSHWLGCVVISLVAILLCYLREKSGSLWTCILCHFVFNSSLLLIQR